MEPLEHLVNELIGYAPRVALFFVVVLGGWLMSRIARRVTVWAVRRTGLEALAERAGTAKLLYAVGLKDGAAQALGLVVWLACILLTVAAAAEMLGLSAVAAGISVVMGFLPRLLAAAIVLIAGLAFAALLRGVVQRVGKGRSDIDDPGLLGQLLYYLILTVTVVMSADQAGLETQLVSTLVTIAAAAVLAGFALAFALGSRSTFQNLVATHYFRRAVRPGDQVRVGPHEGVVVRFSPVGIVLRSADGEIVVPCKTLMEDAVHIDRVETPRPRG